MGHGHGRPSWDYSMDMDMSQTFGQHIYNFIFILKLNI